MKTCSKCAAPKPLDEFYKNQRSPDGRRGDCKACVLTSRSERYRCDPAMRERLTSYARRWQADNPERVTKSAAARRATPAGRAAARANTRRATLKKYGVTPDEFDSMLAEQDGRCAICRSDDPGAWPNWCVDHDHVTGEVRGLLCFHCNTALGHFRDDPVSLAAAIDYLLKPRVELAR